LSNQVLDKKALPEILKKLQTADVDLDFLLILADNEKNTVRVSREWRDCRIVLNSIYQNEDVNNFINLLHEFD